MNLSNPISKYDGERRKARRKMTEENLHSGREDFISPGLCKAREKFRVTTTNVFILRDAIKRGTDSEKGGGHTKCFTHCVQKRRRRTACGEEDSIGDNNSVCLT